MSSAPRAVAMALQLSTPLAGILRLNPAIIGRLEGRAFSGLLAMLCASIFAASANAATASSEVAKQQAPEIAFGDMEMFEAAAPAQAQRRLRTTFGHEISLRTRELDDLINNRSWMRLEYSRFFHERFFLRLDSKLNAFWNSDHRARAVSRSLEHESNTPEAFLQYSAVGGRSSLKVGVQRLIWGESEGGAITDEVSPRNFAELFLIPLEEARVGQAMVTYDHFNPSGEWTAFWVPRPKFNRYPGPGTAYYVELPGIEIEPSTPEPRNEFGGRWKRTFGRSDVSLMAATLVDNDYALRSRRQNANGGHVLAREAVRFNMAGVAFNYARGSYLLKGELGFKSSKRFNDAAFNLLDRKVIDASLGLTRSLKNSNSIGLELVNGHALRWGEELLGTPRNSTSLIANANLFFLDELLNVNWLIVHSRPYANYQSSVRSSYRWSDNLSLGLDLHLIVASDTRSLLAASRDLDQLSFRFEYKF